MNGVAAPPADGNCSAARAVLRVAAVRRAPGRSPSALARETGRWRREGLMTISLLVGEPAGILSGVVLGRPVASVGS
jgi:hypothetical protein